MIATSITIGVSQRAVVRLSSLRSPAAMSPECSATPTPSRATSRIPSGAKAVNTGTISVRKRVSSAPVSRLTTLIVAPVWGCCAANSTGANSADSPDRDQQQQKQQDGIGQPVAEPLNPLQDS